VREENRASNKKGERKRSIRYVPANKRFHGKYHQKKNRKEREGAGKNEKRLER